MIKKADLEEAIAECQGVTKPTSNTCLKLASYFIIKDHMYSKEENHSTVLDMPSTSNMVEISSSTQFASTVNGLNIDEVMLIIDELMSALQIVNPRLYNSAITKLESLRV